MQPWQYVVLAGLGAVHGLNPGMGWLFALAGGVREGRRTAIAATLGPIAVGHAASVFVIATLVTAVMSVTNARLVAAGGGLALTAFGVWRLLTAGRHDHRPGPRPTDLLAWSFLMSSAHGAGLVLVPLLAAVPVPAHHGHAVGAVGRTSAMTGILATTVHTATMVAAAGLVALVAYEVLRLRPVRVRARIDGPRVWAFALVGSGVATLALTVV